MVQWQRRIFPILRHIHKGVVDHHHANLLAPNPVISCLVSSLSQGQLGRRAWPTTPPCFSRPIFLGFQHQGISSSAQLLANSSEETPVLSPLAPVSLLGSSKGEDQKQKAVTKPEKVQAVLKGIKQIPNYQSICHPLAHCQSSHLSITCAYKLNPPSMSLSTGHLGGSSVTKASPFPTFIFSYAN